MSTKCILTLCLVIVASWGYFQIRTTWHLYHFSFEAFNIMFPYVLFIFHAYDSLMIIPITYLYYIYRYLKEFLKALVTEFHNKIFAHQAFILMVHVRVNHYLQLKSSVPLQVFHE